MRQTFGMGQIRTVETDHSHEAADKKTLGKRRTNTSAAPRH